MFHLRMEHDYLDILDIMLCICTYNRSVEDIRKKWMHFSLLSLRKLSRDARLHTLDRSEDLHILSSNFFFARQRSTFQLCCACFYFQWQRSECECAVYETSLENTKKNSLRLFMCLYVCFVVLLVYLSWTKMPTLYDHDDDHGNGKWYRLYRQREKNVCSWRRKVGNDFLLSVVFHGGSSTAVATSPEEVQWKKKINFVTSVGCWCWGLNFFSFVSAVVMLPLLLIY